MRNTVIFFAKQERKRRVWPFSVQRSKPIPNQRNSFHESLSNWKNEELCHSWLGDIVYVVMRWAGYSSCSIPKNVRGKTTYYCSNASYQSDEFCRGKGLFLYHAICSSLRKRLLCIFANDDDGNVPIRECLRCRAIHWGRPFPIPQRAWSRCCHVYYYQVMEKKQGWR